MRIAILIDDFFPASGGIGRSVQTQLEELTRLGHEVTLIAPDRHLQKPRIGSIIECPTIYLEGLPAHLSVLHCSDRRARLISKIAKFDVVHSQTERGALILGAKLARLQGVPHLHSFHANIAGTHQSVRGAIFGTLSYLLLILPFLRSATDGQRRSTRLPSARHETGGLAARQDWRAFAEIAQRVDGYTVPSPFMKDLIEEAAPGAQLSGFVVPTGYNRKMKREIDQAVRERDDETIRFLSVGRLAKEKRLDVLLRAFLKAKVPNSELVLVGDGDQLDRLRRLAGGAANVDFRGHLSSLGAIAYELVNADALVLGSYRFDSQGLVITEAVAAGLPVLYCDDRLTAGISPESALLTGPDVGSLARGFRDLADPALRARLAAGTKALLPGLAPELTAEQYVAAYEALIARRPRG